MAFPLVPIALGTLAAKLISGVAGNVEERKKAAALRKAQEDALRAQTGRHTANEAYRAARMDATNAHLTAGTGRYAIDPATLERMKAPRPFAGSLPADPRAGLGSRLVAGLAGGAGDIGQSLLMGHFAQQNGISGGVPEGVAGIGEAERLRMLCQAMPEACTGMMTS